MSLIFAFLIGSIPSGFIIGQLQGKDIRRLGSGNIGATNVTRVLGKKAGILTLILDVLKGIVAIILFQNLPESNVYLLGLAAIFGHCFSPFLKFKGGKGVATSLGVFLYLSPYQGLTVLIVFLISLKLTHYVSLSSILAALALPVAIYSTNYNLELFQVSLITSALIIYKHKENIERILKGTENKFSKKI